MEYNLDERLSYYAKIAREKGYGQETIEMGWMLACTKNMVKIYGNKEAAFEEVIKLCEKNDDGKQFIGDILKLLGVGNV